MQPLHPAQYNNLIFAAVSEQEQFQNVNVITLKGEYSKKVEAAAIDRLVRERKMLSDHNIATEMACIFSQNTITVQEAVYYHQDDISVVVNAEYVDDAASTRVLNLIHQAIYQLNGTFGEIKFGAPVSFSRHDIPWLNQH